MIECVLSWVMLICGIVYNNPLFFIASAIYAVASNIYNIFKKAGLNES